MRNFGGLLLKNNNNAVIAALICALLPLISLPGGFLAAIIVAFITLCRGGRAGLILLAWVALPAISLLFLSKVGIFDILLLRCAVVWLLAVLLRSYASWRLVLEVTALLGFIAVLVMHLITPDVKAWWGIHLQQYFNHLGVATNWNLSQVQIQDVISRLAPIATGFTALIVLLGTLLPLLLARWWQSVLFDSISLKKEFVNIRMGNLFGIILSAVFIGVLFKMAFFIDFLPVLLMPFMIAGLSLLHMLVMKNKKLLFPLLLIYLGIMLLTQIVVLFLALLGFVDSWYDLRKRFQLSLS